MNNKVFRAITAVLLLLAALMLCSCGANNAANTAKPANSEAAANTAVPAPAEAEKITDEQALAAIKNYCYASNPDLKDIVDAGEYTVYWEISASDEEQIVVLFRSYTAAEIRYYINRATGETYVTEFVSGVTEEEQRTEESFNVKDYIA